jgi:hypothetical protein
VILGENRIEKFIVAYPPLSFVSKDWSYHFLNLLLDSFPTGFNYTIMTATIFPYSKKDIPIHPFKKV